jgi:predicted nucleotide-binding protein
VSGVAITPDGCHAVSASHDSTLRVWDLQSSQSVCILEGHSKSVNGVAIKGRRHWVNGVAITPDGRWAVSASGDKTLRVWDLESESGQSVRTLKGHTGSVSLVAITPDSGRAVSASRDNTLRVWDLQSSQSVSMLKGHSHWVTGVAITTDGRWAVSASLDKTLRVWDLQSGRSLRTLKGHTDFVNAVAVTPDGRHMISASEDKTLRVWDIQSGKEIALLNADASTTSCAVSWDGRMIVAGDGAGNVHFLRLVEADKTKPPIGDTKIQLLLSQQQSAHKPEKATMPPSVRDQVFISYSHKDRDWLERLQTHLKPYLRDGSIKSWSDRQISPGSQWLTEIKTALTNTKVAVLLVTPDLIASDFVHEYELVPFLKEAKEGGVRILWVPVRASAYKKTALKDYQAVLDPAQPLANMTDAERDQAWVRICEEIEKAVNP